MIRPFFLLPFGFLLLIFSLFNHSLAQAASHDWLNITAKNLDPSQTNGKGIILGSHYEVLSDPQHEFSLPHILENGSLDFQPMKEGISPNLGYSRDTFWIKVKINNQTHGETKWMLEFPFPTLDHLDVYLYHPETQTLHSQFITGDQKPFNQRPYLNRSFVFPLTFDQGGEWQLIYRIQSKGSLTIASYLWLPVDFYHHSQNHYMAMSFYFGILAALFLYNALIFVFLKDKLYLLYIGFVGSMALAQLGWHGIGFEYLWPNSPNWGNVAAIFGFNATGMFGAFFSRFFLNLKQNAPLLDRLTQMAAVGFALLILLIPILSYQMIAVMTSINGAIFAIIAMTSGILCFHRGFSSARFYLVANAFLLIATAALGIRNLGWIPTNFFTTYSMLIGSSLEMLLLSFALAERINEMKLAKEMAEQRANNISLSMDNLLKEQDDHIEKKVSLRTQQLHNLAQTDKLTNLGNRHQLEELLPQILNNSQTNETFVGLLFIDLDNFKPINDQYGHAMGDKLLKQVAVQLQGSVRSNDILIRLGGDEFIIIVENLIQAQTLDKIAGSVLKAITQPIIIDQLQLIPGASIGAAIAPFDGKTMSKLLDSADKAMYQAKLLGKNKVFHAQGLQSKLSQTA